MARHLTVLVVITALSVTQAKIWNCVATMNTSTSVTSATARGGILSVFYDDVTNVSSWTVLTDLESSDQSGGSVTLSKGSWNWSSSISGGAWVSERESFLKILSDLNQAVPNHLADEMVRWLTRLTVVCEVIRYRLVQVRQNLKKDFSGWRSAIAFLYLFLFHSLLRPSSFPSQYKNE